MKTRILIPILILFVQQLSAQTIFIQKGKIEFERRTNVHRLYFADQKGSWVDDMKKRTPQFRSDFFELVFNGEKTLYQPGKRETVGADQMGFFNSPGQDNIVFKDLQAGTAVSLKSVFETKFLLTDSLRNAVWRVEAENRIIAGFECRKAVTTICDSVVVVAFYTDQIIPAGGPESFSGLPGMILGLAIPRLYTTWFATKLENIEAVDESKIVPPSRGKKANTEEMSATINRAIKDWGPGFRDRSMWSVSL